MKIFGFGTILAAAILSGANAASLTVPFDFSKGAIGLDVTLKGVPAYMILDTGVDPSAIDTARAEALGLKVDRGTGGEASGEGDAKEAQVFPATIDNLSIQGRSFAPVDALAMDMSTLSAQYGRPLDGVLGYSFLTDKIVLIDYANRKLEILDRPNDALPAVQSCRKRWSTALRSFEGDSIPVIPDFRFGAASTPITLDTGSNRGIALYQRALDLPGLRAALTENGETSSTGARGNTKSKTYVFHEAVGFGPFTLPAGEVVSLSKVEGSPDTRLANIGNKLFAAMKLKMLLDYRAKLMTFYGDCGR
jgi:hypothetical protein